MEKEIKMLNFENNPNFKKISDQEIWVYENFLTPEEATKIYEVAKGLDESAWQSKEVNDHTIDWYNGRTSIRVAELTDLRKKIESLVQGYTVTPGDSFARLFPGDTMHEHEDSCGDEGTTDTDMNGTCAITEYGAVVYFNDDFEGGELYYPALSLSHPPKSGDLVIHGSRIRHGIAEVKKGIRYSFPTFLYKEVK